MYQIFGGFTQKQNGGCPLSIDLSSESINNKWPYFSWFSGNFDIKLYLCVCIDFPLYQIMAKVSSFSRRSYGSGVSSIWCRSMIDGVSVSNLAIEAYIYI